MKNRLATLVAATTTLVGASLASPAGAASASSITGTIPLLRLGTPYSISTLDLTKNTGAFVIDNLTLETLVNLGPQAQIEPNLASSVTEPNLVSYVYHLRHGVKFWDGDPLTAADVAYSLNYYRRPGSQVAYEFPAVKSITASGPYTVVVTLPGPNPAWQYTPGLPLGIFEAKFAEEHKATFGNPGTLVMGTGPWEVKSLDPTTGADLTANPDWWGGKVPIQHISVRVFSNETSLALAFRAGEIDLDPAITDAQTFAATSGAKLLNAPSCQGGFFSMNTHIAPWSDVHIRRAVAYALDRQAIIVAAGGYATPRYTFIPTLELRTVASQAQVDNLLSSLNLYPYSIANARREMAESAYPQGVKTTISVYNYGDEVNVAQVVVAELQKIGIDAQLKVVQSADLGPVWTGPAANRPTAVWGGGCIDPDVSGYDFYLGSSNTKQGEWNIADYDPPVVDKLLSEGTTITDPAQRFSVYSQLLKQLSIDVPYVPLYLHDYSVALSDKFTAPGYNYWYWLDNDYALDVKPAN